MGTTQHTFSVKGEVNVHRPKNFKPRSQEYISIKIEDTTLWLSLAQAQALLDGLTRVLPELQAEVRAARGN